MLRNRTLTTLLLTFLFTALSHAGDAKPLFDGKTTKGWKNPYDWGEVKVEDGAIALKANKKFFLATEETFKDFILEAKVMLPPEGKSNSGIMFRCHVKKNKVFGYQAECDPTDRAWTGGLYDEGRRKWLHPTNAERGKTKLYQAPLGEWIQYKIVCKGDHLQIFINGKKTTDFHDSMDAEGHIAIQHHGEDGQVYRFKDIKITKL